MPGKSVAVEGGVTATAGSQFFPPADSGAWTAGSVTYQAYPNLKVNNTNVIYQAQCIFTFSGADSSSGGAPVTPPGETVTLTAGTTLLQKRQFAVLVDGDSVTDSYGNKLEVSSSGPLKTE